MTLLRYLLYLTIVWVAASALFAGIIEIPKDAATIQGGIEIANDFDTLLVEPGDYTENIELLGKEVIIIAFAGPEVTHLTPADPYAPIVSFINDEDYKAELTGFTIYGATYDHAVFIDSGASPWIHDNIFHDNILNDVFDKAVITSWSDSSFPVIQRNIFYDNYGMTCIWIQKGKGDIINNTIDNNRAAVMCNTGMGVVRNNIIGNCLGIAIEGAFSLIDYNDLWNNSSDYG